jgi:hypothetical protein
MIKEGKADAKALEWLLEKSDPGVRYLALRDLAKTAGKELADAREKAHTEGPIAAVLKEMKPESYWEKPGAGYNPKYTSSVWSLILLAQLGADTGMDQRIGKAAAYILDHSMTQYGIITANGIPSGMADCHMGNILYSLIDLGYADPRLDKAIEMMARLETGDGIAPMAEKKAEIRYYSGKCGPIFACGANDKQSCAWGAVSVMQALSKYPKEKRTPLINRAIKTGVDFFFSTDPAKANYPSPYTGKPSGNWWKFGFPVFYVQDILHLTESLVRLGFGKDPRLDNAIQLIRDKQDKEGCWALEYDYTGKTWVDFGLKKQPSKWVTLRALRVLDMIA